MHAAVGLIDQSVRRLLYDLVRCSVYIPTGLNLAQKYSRVVGFETEGQKRHLFPHCGTRISVPYTCITQWRSAPAG